MSLPPQEIAYEEAHINQNIGYQLIVTETVFGAIAVAGVVTRLWAKRTRATKLFTVDDYLVFGALFFAIGLIIVTCMSTAYGVGKHIILASMYDLTTFAKLNFAVEILYPASIALAKLSLVALYGRTLAIERFQRIILWFVAAWITLWMIGTYLDVFLECRPLSSIWEKECAPSFLTSVLTGVFNVLSDVAILIFPQPILWKLNMPLNQKIGLAALFLVGLFATAISLARIPILKASNSGGSPDITYHLIPTYIFTVVEPLVAITCACAPFYLHVGQAIGSFGSSLRSFLNSSRNNRSGYKSTEGGEDSLSLPSTIGSSSKRKLWGAHIQPENHPLPKLNHVATVVEPEPEPLRGGQIYVTSQIHQEKTEARRGDDMV